VAAGEAKLVGAGHQLLDQSAFADTGRSADYHGARKSLGGLYDSWGCCHLLSGRGSLRALSCAHACNKSAQVPYGETSPAETRQMQLPDLSTLRVSGCWFREVALKRACMRSLCEKPKRGAKGHITKV